MEGLKASLRVGQKTEDEIKTAKEQAAIIAKQTTEKLREKILGKYPSKP